MSQVDVHRQLLSGLRPLGRRLRWRASIELLARTAWLALGASAVILLAGRLFPLDGYRHVAGAVLLLWLVAWALYSLGRPFRPPAVARRADTELGLRDRLSTALFLSDSGRPIATSFDHALVSSQLHDARTYLQRVEPRHVFPIRFERVQLWCAGATLLIAALLLYLPNPMDQVVAERARIAQVARAEATKLDKVVEQIEQDKNLSLVERHELTMRLRELSAQLKANPGDAKQALAQLAAMQEQLRSRLNPAAATQQAALDALAQQLAQLAGAPDKPKDAADTAKLLEDLASKLSQLSPDERAALAGALERAASQTAATNSDLASALAAMAQTARTGSGGANTQRAASQGAAALRDAADQQALQQALAQALNQAEASQRAVAQASGGDRQGTNQAQAQQQGTGQSQGQGAGQGQGQGQGQGNQPGQGQGSQPGGGGGTTANSLPPGTRRGSAGNPTGGNKPYGVGDAETVFTPFRAGQGRAETVTGQQGQQGETNTQEGKSPLPGTNNPALVPYDQVFQQYAETAGQTMERSYIPSGLKDYVKEYFSGLEP